MSEGGGAIPAAELDAEVVAVYRETGTVLDLEGLHLGYLPHVSEDALRASLRRCRRRGDLVPSGGRRGFYVHCENARLKRQLRESEKTP